MFNEKSYLQPIAEEQGVLAPKRRGTYPISMPWEVDLGALTNQQALTWRLLPATHTKDWLVKDTGFALAATQPMSGTAVLTDGASHDLNYVAVSGVQSYSWNGTTFGTSQPIRGCAYGLLGAWVVTTGLIYQHNQQEGQRVHTPEGMWNLNYPVEYNGALFFTAQRGSDSTRVIGYWETPLFLETQTFGPEGRWQNEYFSIEHLGLTAAIGVWDGLLVVASNRGVWRIEAGSEGGYKLGSQVAAWDIPHTGVQWAIGGHSVCALAGGTLYVLTATDRSIYPNTRFTNIKGDGSRVVLSRPWQLGEAGPEIAVSNGADFETYDGYTAAGTLLINSQTAQLYLPERVPLSPATSYYWIETTMAELDSWLCLEDVIVHDTVEEIEVVTDRRTYVLKQSHFNPHQWRAGITVRFFKLRFKLKQGRSLEPMIINFRNRSRT
jgi:hypothetical protein